MIDERDRAVIDERVERLPVLLLEHPAERAQEIDEGIDNDGSGAERDPVASRWSPGRDAGGWCERAV